MFIYLLLMDLHSLLLPVLKGRNFESNFKPFLKLIDQLITVDCIEIGFWEILHWDMKAKR